MKLVQKHNLNKHHCFGNPGVGINSMYWGCVEANGPKFGFETLITPGAFDFCGAGPLSGVCLCLSFEITGPLMLYLLVPIT